MSLPELLASYGEKRVQQLVGLQRHQHDAFHVFLCYLAGAVLAKRNETNPIQKAEYWREGLLRLADSAGMDAWRLVVDDPAKPAFMQPPLLTADQKPTSVVTTPDELDVLQTAKNHDVKRARANWADVDTWIYSLISLQTMSGFMGRGNQGISRMNSGFGNRPIVEVIRTHNIGERWLDAVSRLLDHRHEVFQKPFGFKPDGMVLVWLAPWDGEQQLSLQELDPFYVEICRRVRLKGPLNSLSAMLYSANQQRIAAKQLAGVVGDAWLPIDETRAKMGKDGQLGGIKALTFPPTGITIEHLRSILFGDYVTHALQRPHPSWQNDLRLSVSVLVRGQGTTDGFYSKEVRIPRGKVSILFGSAPKRDWLGGLSRSGIDSASAMRNRVLKYAVFSYLQGAPDDVKWDQNYSSSVWTSIERRFESLWSDEYFPWLFSLTESESEDAALERWINILRQHGLQVIEEAVQVLPSHTGRQYQVKTAIRSRFWGAYFRTFPNMRGDDVGQSTV